MMTVGDIHNVTFEKSMRGYRAEDVDEFLSKVAQEFDALIRERDDALDAKDAAVAAAAQEKEEADKKLYILAEKIEQYRGDEENLKVALLNAQRLGETVVYEAKQKAENIVYEAKTKAAQIRDELKSQQASEESKLSTMRSEVSKFKSEVLDLYKHHIEMLSALPSQDEKKASPIVFTVGETSDKMDTMPTSASQTEEPMRDSAEKSKRKTAAKSEDVVEAKQGTFDFGNKDETKTESFENYQGIRFDE